MGEDLTPQDRPDEPALEAIPPAPRRDGPQVLDDLRADPYGFDFFHAVRRLECDHPHLPPIGKAGSPRGEPVRFCQPSTLAFPPSTLDGVRDDPKCPVPRLFQHFLGVLGCNGPLPLHVTEYVRDRDRQHGDRTLGRFLDLFHHRMVAMFYRAWAINQQPVSHDRPLQDPYVGYVGSLLGIGMPSLRQRDRVGDVAKLHYSGRLSPHAKCAEGLSAILQDYFKVDAQVLQFFGHWVDVPADSQCRLGESRRTGLVGSSVIVGSRLWDCQNKFRLRMGPMRLADFERLLPTGQSLGKLTDWVAQYAGLELLWDLQLVLRRDEVPPVRLGKGGRLGWTTWLASQPLRRDPDDLVLRPVR